jgi:hypothetical protein
MTRIRLKARMRTSLWWELPFYAATIRRFWPFGARDRLGGEFVNVWRTKIKLAERGEGQAPR